jgi:hypothetical protein
MSHTYQGDTNTYHYNSDMSEVKVLVPTKFVHLQETFKRTELDPDHEVDEEDYYAVELDPRDLKVFFAGWLRDEMVSTLQNMPDEQFLRWIVLQGQE